MEYSRFFYHLTGHPPFPYQVKLGVSPWPDLVEIPTGLGKTAAIVVAWLYKRLKGDAATPRRLLYCLPMRVLVEQTAGNITTWLERAAPLFGAAEVPLPGSFPLMGGERNPRWVEDPGSPAIIVGTQDMLLSRALMRGYGMSRYQWPMHFALVHNDAFWVFDEIQLMGAGLATSAQLEAFRRSLGPARPSRSLWVSATLNRDWLATVDLKEQVASFRCLGLDAAEMEEPVVARRRQAGKRLSRAGTMLTAENSKQRARQYVAGLAAEVLARHQPGTTTLVILNSVERTQALLAAIDRTGPAAETFLVHSRFRPGERSRLNRRLAAPVPADGPGRIIVATQAVEAGVDMTSRVLFTELAPWSSLVQRFGRCNRYGEVRDPAGAGVFWIDIQDGAGLESPYDPQSLAASRENLLHCDGVSPAELPGTDEQAPVGHLLRRRDFLELFNTDPDLSGFDVDVAPYIRDTSDTDIFFFWRSLEGEVDPELRPAADELCRASLRQAAALLKRLDRQQGHALFRDSLAGEWRPFRDRIRPGLVLMLDSGAGGYSVRYGLQPESRVPVPAVENPGQDGAGETYGNDWRSLVPEPVPLAQHLADTLARARQLCRLLALDGNERDALLAAAARHDVGKAHPVFQATMHGCSPGETGDRPLLAKSPKTSGRHRRRYFRHELASMLAWLLHAPSGGRTDLVAYLIAAHHGKVRMSLRAMPDEPAPRPGFGPRFARGVWEGDGLPPVRLPDGAMLPATRLRLDIMELGRGGMSPSWAERTQRLLEQYGPFRLAWLETLVRLADWLASGAEQEGRS